MEAPKQSTKDGELVRHWLASGVLENGGAMHGDGLAMKLYRTCLDIIQEICQQRVPLVGERSLRGPTELLREELGKLYLWGESFTPGQLDKTLNHAEDLRTVVIKALQQIGKLLLHVQSLTTFIDQARTIVSQMSEESFQKNDCSDSESSSDENDVLKSDGLEGLARRIQVQTSHLIRVGPTIQKTLTCAEKAEAQSPFPPVVPFKVSDPAAFYVSSIREKFKQAQDHLVARLGEANWQRHHHVRNIPLRDGGLPNEQLDDAENATAFFRPYSAFYDSGIGTSIPNQTEYAASHTSFLSSKSETKLGGLKVPQSPQQIVENKPFQCFLCGRTQLNIRNRVDWKMHVFADLKPYICTFSECKMELAQFPSRAAWAEHEFSQHRITCSWRCAECLNEYPTRLLFSEHLHKMHQRKHSNIDLQMAVDIALDRQEKPAEKEECPLCRLVLGCSKRAFVKHVGRHMEQIALMALPRETEESETNNSDATDDSKEDKLSMASGGASRESKHDMSHSYGVEELSNNQHLIPSWLIQATEKLQESHPEIDIEVVTGWGPDRKLMIKCWNCLGNLYFVGPGKTLKNFQIHLKNSLHEESVKSRLQEGAENWSSHPKNVDQPEAKPHIQDGTVPKAGILQPDAEGTHDSTDAHNIRDTAYKADADGFSSTDSTAGPRGIKYPPLVGTVMKGYTVYGDASGLRPRESSPLSAIQNAEKHVEITSDHDSENSLELANEKSNEERQTLPGLSYVPPPYRISPSQAAPMALAAVSGQSYMRVPEKSTPTSSPSEFDQRKGSDTVTAEERMGWPLETGEAGEVQKVSSNSHTFSNLRDEALVTPSGTKKPEPHSKSRAIPPWTPAEEQRLRAMRDAGKTWKEIAK
ncbi:MAG: hypothetical protein Q9167_007662, partial [Letrouitia subvulpina]